MESAGCSWGGFAKGESALNETGLLEVFVRQPTIAETDAPANRE
jgi:hypothetical protein